mmetsp:Transcript_25887/g.39167  ORF Transcript_25887/g.39167 Transcript_25887/m.39167 type:complete len:147 (+) Transcript_25887:55-495(+)
MITPREAVKAIQIRHFTNKHLVEHLQHVRIHAYTETSLESSSDEDEETDAEVEQVISPPDAPQVTRCSAVCINETPGVKETPLSGAGRSHPQHRKDRNHDKQNCKLERNKTCLHFNTNIGRVVNNTGQANNSISNQIPPNQGAKLN